MFPFVFFLCCFFPYNDMTYEFLYTPIEAYKYYQMTGKKPRRAQSTTARLSDNLPGNQKVNHGSLLRFDTLWARLTRSFFVLCSFISGLWPLTFRLLSQIYAAMSI